MIKNGTSDDKPKPLELPKPQPLPAEVVKPKTGVVEREVVVSLAELDELRASVAQARGSQKLRLLLDAPIPGAVVQRMPPQELMITIKEIGKADCAEIVELATPEQISVCLDLDCWSKDEFQLEELDDWLMYLTAGEFLAAERILQSLDVEMLVYYIRQLMQIHYLVDEDWPNDTEGDIIEMPDRVYIVHVPFPHDDQRSTLAHALVQLLMQYGYEFYQRLFEWVRWGQDSDLREIGYQFRKARLEDHGFIDYFEAIGIYQALPPKAKLPARVPVAAETEQVLPILAPPKSDSLFAQAAQRVEDDALKLRLEQELMYLTNKVLCADQIDPGHAQAVRQTTRRVQRTLDLGLESLAGPTPEEAAQILTAHPLEWVFRVGFTATARLRKKARRMTKRDNRFGFDEKSPASLLPSTWQHALEVTRQSKPRYHTSLDTPPGTTARPFRSLQDVERASDLLDAITLLPALFFDEFGFDFDELKGRIDEEGRLCDRPVEDIHFSHLFLTALAQYALHGTFVLKPLTGEEVKDFLNQIFTPADAPPHQLDANFQANVEAELLKRPGTTAAHNVHLQRFLQDTWEQLRDQAAHLPYPLQNPPDTRFLDLLLVQKGA